jgi:protein involved in temperature-dependent protein secretion
LDEIIPILKEQIRNNPSDGKIHLELAKGLAMGGRLDEAKAECDKAMLKFPTSDRHEVWNLQKEIDKMIRKRDLGY